MWFKKAKKIKEQEGIIGKLTNDLFELDRSLNEAQQFERICDGKLKLWVDKYYWLLEKYKGLSNGQSPLDGSEPKEANYITKK